MGWAGRYGEYLKSVRLLENNYVMPQKDEIIGHVKRFLYSKHAASHGCGAWLRLVRVCAAWLRASLCHAGRSLLNARSRRCCMLPVRLCMLHFVGSMLHAGVVISASRRAR